MINKISKFLAYFIPILFFLFFWFIVLLALGVFDDAPFFIWIAGQMLFHWYIVLPTLCFLAGVELTNSIFRLHKDKNNE